MRARPFKAAILGLALLAAAPSAGRSQTDLDAALSELHDQDLRVAAIALRLSTANVEVCDDVGPQWGMTLHSASQYGPRLRPTAVRHFGLGDAVAISVVVPGGPADRAGLRPGDEIVAVAAVALPTVRSGPRAPASYDQVGRATAALAALSQTAELTVRRAGEVTVVQVTPQRGCAYDIQLLPSEAINASADGDHVFVTLGFARYAARDEDLALVLGHEYAHDVLHHRAQLDATGVMRRLLGNLGSSPAALNRAEREADYVGLYLTAQAGYEVSGAQAFWRRMRMDLGDSWLTRWSHPGAREREANALATAAEIAALRASARPLRWDPARLRHG